MLNKKNKLHKHNRFGYIFVAPFFIIFSIFQLYPIFYTIFLSFTNLRGWETTYSFVNFDNYINLLNNPLFIKSVTNTFLIWLMNFIPQILLALLLAAWFTSIKLRIKKQPFFKAVIYLPNIITAASVAVLFYSLFAFPAGPVNQLLVKFGVLEKPFEFFRSVLATRSMVAFIQMWMWYGQTTIILLAGIISIDSSMFEAAMVDGASDRQIFFRITLPLLKPIMLYVLVTSMIGGLQMFDIPHLLRGGTPENSVMTIAMYIYNQAFTGGRNYDLAAAASVVLLIISAVMSILMFGVLRERVSDER